MKTRVSLKYFVVIVGVIVGTKKAVVKSTKKDIDQSQQIFDIAKFKG